MSLLAVSDEAFTVLTLENNWDWWSSTWPNPMSGRNPISQISELPQKRNEKRKRQARRMAAVMVKTRPRHVECRGWSTQSKVSPDRIICLQRYRVKGKRIHSQTLKVIVSKSLKRKLRSKDKTSTSKKRLEMTNPSQAPSMSYGMMTATRRSLKLSLL
jgi:hypothetical protein